MKEKLIFVGAEAVISKVKFLDLDAIKKGVVLFGQEAFVKFIKELRK